MINENASILYNLTICIIKLSRLMYIEAQCGTYKLCFDVCLVQTQTVIYEKLCNTIKFVLYRLMWLYCNSFYIVLFKKNYMSVFCNNQFRAKYWVSVRSKHLQSLNFSNNYILFSVEYQCWTDVVQINVIIFLQVGTMVCTVVGPLEGTHQLLCNKTHWKT